MKKEYILTFILSITVVIFPLKAQTHIGLGWAKNSINVPVFRKNSVVTFNGTQFTSFYDSTGYVILAKRQIGTDTWEINKTQHTGNIDDAHCSISIGVDGDGYLHMAWNHHNTSMNYCISSDPGSIVMGEKTTMLGTLENDVTYPEFFKMPNGDLLFMYRYGVSGRGNLVVNKYITAEKRWERLHNVLIDGQNVRNAYWQSFVDRQGTIHVSWVWRETWDVATNHDMCYAKSEDGGLTWKKSNGDTYTVPITAATSEYISYIPQNSELINQTSMYADSYGRPYIASFWTPAGSSVPQYHLIYHDGEAWVTKQISDRKTPFSLSGGGTKKIPISRPQIVVDDSGDTPVVYLIYRDIERDSKASVNKSISTDLKQWEVYDITESTVNSWEPTYDPELWKDSMILNIFIQRAGQGDGETLEDLPAQPVFIQGITDGLSPADTITIEEITSDKCIQTQEDDFVIFPNPLENSLNINGKFRNAEVTIFSATGNKIYQEFTLQAPASISLTGFPSGLYLANLKSGEMNKTLRFIIR
jgi:hypothetical protein